MAITLGNGINTICTLMGNQVNTLSSSGSIKIYSGASPGPNVAVTGTLLVTLPLPASGSNSVSTIGVITFLTTGMTASAVGNNTAGYFRMLDSSGTNVICDGTCGTGGGFDLNLNTTSIVSGATVAVTSFTFTISP